MQVSNSAKVFALVRDGRVDIGFVEGHTATRGRRAAHRSAAQS
jgi:hypothetical protein